MKISLWAEIHRLREVERLSVRSISRRLHCSRWTVQKALSLEDPPTKKRSMGGSIIDRHLEHIDALIRKYPDLSAPRVLEEIAKKGYPGEITLVRKYLQRIRPARGRVYQEVQYDPGQAMQVDWGCCGTVKVGDTSRKLSVFVSTLCFSRMIYIEFTLNQSKETFYRAIVNSLKFFEGCPDTIIVDNLKAAVLEGSGRHCRFHPEFAALCAYHRMRPIACERADPESKGIVEGAVRYVKHNALKGRHDELATFEDYQRFSVYWRDEVANVRKHATTGEKPIERVEKERGNLRSLPSVPYDTDEVVAVTVNPHARICYGGNLYSVPPRYTRKQVLLRVDGRLLRVLYDGEEVARHRVCYEKKRVVIDPAHRKAALGARKRTRARQIEEQFDLLAPEARAFRLGLMKCPVKPIVHLRRMFNLIALYGKAEVLDAIAAAVEYETFDSAYIQNLIDQRRRKRQLPSPIVLAPRRRDLLEDVHLEEPDPGEYDRLSE